MNPEVAVLGAGAAGMMCAIAAARRGRRVLVLEHNRGIGEKIRISGGGRCNFTNTGASPANFHSANPRFCTSALARFTPRDFIAMVERHGIAYHEKKLGQLFCDGSSQAIIDLLRAELAQAGGEVALGHAVSKVERDGADASFNVHTSQGKLCAESVVVATGGLSIPKLGATGIGYEIARALGVRIVEPKPGLVPLTWREDDAQHFADMSGLSVETEATFGAAKFRENTLFTHRGLSGPAILQISTYWDGSSPITLDLAPDGIAEYLREEKRHGSRAELKAALCQLMPARLAERWCAVHDVRGVVCEQKDARLDEIARMLRAWQVTPAGTEGYKKAEVTACGVDTRDLDPKTMQARAVPGLYFIGEVVDVTGWLGGYNFQWAWASGHAAGGHA